jgi:hypothetical protein
MNNLPVPSAISPLRYCRSLWRDILPSWIEQFSFRLFFMILALASILPWPMARAEDGDLGNFNTAEGAFALDMVGSGGGKYNTAIGYGALHLDTAGTNNTADGAYALTANVTGNYNVANGFSALASNRDGSSNTADGYRTLNANTSGSFNTAMGFGALTSNATGIDNTAIGSGALSNSNSASFNTAIGFNALFNNTASNNTATGFEALLNNTTGTQNTATGGATLFKSTTGNNNTADGFEALFSNTTGSNNTADGLLALETTRLVTTTVRGASKRSRTTPLAHRTSLWGLMQGSTSRPAATTSTSALRGQRASRRRFGLESKGHRPPPLLRAFIT